MYQKTVIDGYIISICKGTSNGNITEEEYNTILEAIRTKPTAQEGYDYKLKDGSLTWELYQLPPTPAPSPEDEISDTEALQTITEEVR